MRIAQNLILGLVVAALAWSRPNTTPYSFAAETAAGQKKSAQKADDNATAADLLKRLRTEHPRLMIHGDELKALERQIPGDPTLARWDKEIRQAADKLLNAPLPKHELPDGKRLLSTSRSVVDRTYTLSWAYRRHGDRRHRERLWQEMETVAAFPDWNPSHFLDTAEMTHAVAIAYDWLYDAWTADQRKTLREAIVRHGLRPGLEAYRKGWWAKSTHNWNQVCNGGMTLGALAIGEEMPEVAGPILQYAVASLPRAMQSYAPDGAWAEGPGYWAYATQYNVLMIAGLQSALGTDLGLGEAKGFADTGLFPIYMNGPTGRLFNFEDSGDRIGRSECLWWLARRFHQPACAGFAGLDRGKPTRGTALAMVWRDGPGQDPIAAHLRLDKYWRTIEVATFRSRWEDPRAVFFGIQAGSNRVNHNHLDIGSWVFDALGQRWAVDLGGDNYNLPGYFGKERYDYYRLRAEGHNTLVLNPDQKPDQDLQATACIARFVSRENHALAVTDLTPAYLRHAERVERGFEFLARHDLLVQDEVEAEKPADLWWFLHTPAAVSLAEDGRTATLAAGGEKLKATILGPDGARFEVRAAAPLPGSPQPKKQAQNDNVRKLTIHMPAVTKVRLAVLLTPLDGAAATVPVLRPLAEWK